ncbi:MAG: hypothetical protein GWN58_24635 [Anaerolineae bacterium]|nr:hypothetical protein [Anaerolineae bacterium]
MTKYAVWYAETDWEQSSDQPCHVKVHEEDIWPIDDNSVSGAKDTLADGDHPVVAIGGRTAADGRPQNLTGVVLSYDADATQAVVDVCPSRIVRTYVSNILTYAQGAPATWEAAPALGQPVYVDDSDDLGAGTTLSMAAANTAGVDNPLAGWLFYCQDEYADSGVGGPNSSDSYPRSWDDDEDYEYLVCVLLSPSTP